MKSLVLVIVLVSQCVYSTETQSKFIANNKSINKKSINLEQLRSFGADEKKLQALTNLDNQIEMEKEKPIIPPTLDLNAKLDQSSQKFNYRLSNLAENAINGRFPVHEELLSLEIKKIFLESILEFVEEATNSRNHALKTVYETQNNKLRDLQKMYKLRNDLYKEIVNEIISNENESKKK